MSGNPFRRNAPPAEKLQAEEQRVERAPSPFKIGKKEKRVKIQTPPHSPDEETPRRLSAGNISPPPPERSSSSDDESDTTATADSDIEQAVRNTRRNSGSLPPPGTETGQVGSGTQSPVPGQGAGARAGGGMPYNPFTRTLATSEAAFGLQRNKDVKDEGEPLKPEARKKGMDVDMFKNILMTGSPAPTPPRQQMQTQTQTQDNGSSNSNTDASSTVSKHSSLFDQSYNIHPESPRSSFDHHLDDSDEGDAADDERGGLMGANKVRLDDFAPPAPPKPGLVTTPPAAKGPQTVSFADFDDFSPVDERSLSPANAAFGDKRRPPRLHRTASDLNKPLPKTPPGSPGLKQQEQSTSMDEVVHPASMDAQVQPVGMDAQAQPPTPTITSPNETTKKAPPPPPTSRRAGQGGTRARGSSDATQETEFGLESPPPKAPDSVPKSGAAPPPPPPSRKSKPPAPPPAPAIGTPVSETPSPVMSAPSASENKPTQPSQPPPAPAPRRNPSTTAKADPASMHRSPSTASRSSAQSHGQPPAVPPAPPPRRAAGGSKRESLDGGASAGNSWRRSSRGSFESARSGSLSMGKSRLGSESEEPPPPLPQEAKGQEQERDVLADMRAFEAEIEALRK